MLGYLCLFILQELSVVQTFLPFICISETNKEKVKLNKITEFEWYMYTCLNKSASKTYWPTILSVCNFILVKDLTLSFFKSLSNTF